MPEVSVILNTYNRSRALRNVLATVRDQTYGDFEVIVVDDGSTDDTVAYLAAIEDPRVRYVSHPNMGLTASRNAGAKLAGGRWLAFLDDDDTVEATWLDRLMEITGPDVGIVSCGHRRITEAGVLLGTAVPVDLGPAFHHCTGSFLPGSWAMRSDVFERCGEYLDGLPFIHQFELLLRATTVCEEESLRTPVIADALLNYTVRDSSSRLMLWPRYAFDGGRWVLARHAEAFARDPSAAANHEAVVGVAAARCGAVGSARRHLLRSVRAEPRSIKRWMRLLGATTPWSARRMWGTGPPRGGQALPLPLVQRLPVHHRRRNDHLFLPWRYATNPELSSDVGGTPYWHDPSRNDTRYQEPVYRKARQLSRQARSTSALDVGTGSGVKFERLVAPHTQLAVGLDQSSGIAIARARAPHLEWVDGDLLSDETWQQIAGRSFDLIICADVIEHVDDPVTLLRKIVAAMTPSSTLLISTPDRLRFDRPTPAGPPDNPRHIREWTRDEFELLVESVGLRVEKAYSFLPRSYAFSGFELKRTVWRLLHWMPVPDRRSNMAFLCSLCQ